MFAADRMQRVELKDRLLSRHDISWFDGVGRSYYLQLTHKFGGKL
jgi:hypothetical protein